jgi:2-oxoglutarate ferredoxin oxidoreductase subunit gamma
VCLSQPAADKYFEDLKVRGTAIIDRFYVRECPREGAICVPMTETARNELGRELFTNIVMLGVLAQITRVVKLESLEKAVAHRAPAKTLDLNKKALALGWQLGAGQKDRGTYGETKSEVRS